MYSSQSAPNSIRPPHTSPVYHSPAQSAMENLLPRPVPVARASLRGKYYSPTTTIQRIDSSSTLGGSLSSSPATVHSPSGQQHFSIDIVDGPFADLPPTLPPKEPQQKPTRQRPTTIAQPIRSSSSWDFTSGPAVNQRYASPQQAPLRPLRTSSSRDIAIPSQISPRSMSSRQAMAYSSRSVSSKESLRHSPRSMSSREVMKRPPTGGTGSFALPREAPRISPKASMPVIAKPFPRKMSVASQPSTIAASTNAGTRTRKQEMSQPGRVQAMSMKNECADVKDIPREPKKPNSCLRDCLDCCCCIFGTGACWSDH